MADAHILFVDDDAALRQVVLNQLALMGYDVAEASNGAEAIEKLLHGRYDLMLLDINMPEKSGIEVLKFIQDKKIDCKVIMLTGRVGFSIATESLKLGAVEYITKPFNLEYLLTAIERVLAKPGDLHGGAGT
jgi:DNA-binding NtrC family response regulator